MAHCYKCHGPDKRSGGLRLDQRTFALAGGDSAGVIIGGTLKSNELYHRVSSTDRTYRMPKNADPLPDDELDRLRRWVEQGAVWPKRGGDNPETESFLARWTEWVALKAQQHEFEYVHSLPYLTAFLAVQFLLLLVVRIQTAYRRQRRWTSGRLRWLAQRLSRLTGRELTLVWLLTVAGLIISVMHFHQQATDLQLAKKIKNETDVKKSSVWSNTVFGYPPVPVRPDHPRRVAGTYYRGNCERNEELFNNGNYLTAIFRIHLCDAEGTAVDVGDPIPDNGLFVYFEIERAPGTTDILFTEELMSAVFLSPEFYDNAASKRRDVPVGLETIEKGHRWTARVPVDKPNAEGNMSGLIYVYTGRVEGNTVRGSAHYAIKYDLHIAKGVLAPESDLWMSSFGTPGVASPAPAGSIPFTEWFDYRPIPAITGENTKDPKLLGVEEYVRKGLIKEPQPAQSDK